MKKTLTRLFTVALLLMVSLGARAEVKVLFGVNGTELQPDKDGKVTLGQKELTGGTVIISQEDQKNGTTKLFLAVTPDKGYRLAENGLEVYTVAPADISQTRTVKASTKLDIKSEDFKDEASKRTYTATIDANLALWLKSANFLPQKRENGAKATGDPDYSGTYYIGSTGYNASKPTENFYLCPTEGWCYYQAADDFTGTDNGMPFLTTHKCRDGNYSVNEKAVWMVEKHPTENYYYIRRASDSKYIVLNGQINTTTDPNRMRVHIEALDNPDEKALFALIPNSTSYNIKPQTLETYLTVNGGNDNSLKGVSGKSGGPEGYTDTKGIIGIYPSVDKNSQFYLERAISIDPPAITNNFTETNTITITTETGTTIFYTTDGSTPTTSEYTGTGTNPVNITIDPNSDVRVIKAIAYKEGDIFPTAVRSYALPVCERPVILVDNGMVTINCATSEATVLYTTSGEITPSSPHYSIPFNLGDATIVKVIATKLGYSKSSEAVYAPPLMVQSSDDMTDMSRSYILASNFTSNASVGTSDNPFKGTIDGQLNTISGLGHALVAYADGATIKNVILDNVSISDGTNVGAICNEATGDTRIYNCGVLSGSVGGSNKVGGIIGLLDGNSRVINCYNYANITSGSDCGGIVGYNKVASTSGNLKTMVMNCMFYGDITGGNPAPIYGGEIIHNKPVANNSGNTGLNNYNYYLYKDQSYLSSINSYDIARGALGAEERYLNRFEFFRLTLNSTRNLAAFYVSGDATQKELMAKWVLDKSIAPYPILKQQDYYPSIINPDADHATQISLTDETDRNKGRKFGELTLKIQLDDDNDNSLPFHHPDGAGITTLSKPLNVTDKDYDNYNFNYKKIQLPYYCEVGTGNHTGNRVVTGWKIVKINGSTTGSGTFVNSGSEVIFDESGNVTSTPFNFVDRKCTNKDLYSKSGRVFNQGSYWEVPDGVSEITIEPYWGKCVYLSDAYYDVTYNGATKYDVTVAGSFSKPTVLGDQAVYYSVSDAWSNLESDASHTVYDYAIVLVGNYHQYGESAAILNDDNNKPVTFMSADLDGDCEPDNTLFYYQNNRRPVSPIRFDFLNIPGIGTVKRTWDSGMSPQPGIFKPKGWFEITNTVVVRFGQFEYANGVKTIEAPLILQGGIYEQFVSGQNTAAQNTNYLLIGGNAWFNTFANGCHTEKFLRTPKVPINVTGGEYKKFYLSGIYQATGTPTAEDAECYIDGGKFEEVAGSGMQKINGNVTWFVNGADITKFYGGGTNAAQPITGNIRTTISNSHVDEFYGGPKFGDVASNKTVVTKADYCHFGKFYGAGFGGTAFNRFDAVNYEVPATFNTAPWSTYVSTHYGRQYNSDTNKKGISTNYEYEYILHSDGSRTVARFFVNYASLSLASTRNVTSNLNDCVIGTFFGGGRLGAVNGDVNSTLTDCHVTGSAFGAGFSAEAPTVDVWPIENLTPAPEYNRVAGVFNDASVQFPTGVEYTWKHAESVSAGSEFNETGGHYILTTVNLDGLGAVNGNATLNLKGGTIIDGNVYGGGDSSPVNGSATVNILE